MRKQDHIKGVSRNGRRPLSRKGAKELHEADGSSFLGVLAT
jgi:hypothetical protein